MNIKIIREMTKKELIDEILSEQKEHLEDQSIEALKATVIDIRLQLVKKRLVEESDMEEVSRFFGGSFVRPKQDDDDE